MDDPATLARRRAPCFLIGPVAVLCLAVSVVAASSQSPEEQNEAAKVARKMEKALGTAREAEALRHFEEEVAEYAELHAKQIAKLGLRLPADAQGTVAAQKALAHAMVVKRATAKPGDIFRPEVWPLFRRLIAEQLQGPDGLDARKTVLDDDAEDEDPVPVVVRINAEYPPGAPRPTVPPSLLLTLPPLPACLHYRLVDRELILVDSVAQLIVDFLPAAVPDLAVE